MKLFASLGLCFLSSRRQRRLGRLAFLPFQKCRRLDGRKRSGSMNLSSSSSNDVKKSSFWEVEQKFAITASGDDDDTRDNDDDVRERLTRAGLQESKNCKKMVDWYFDVPEANYPLIRQDCWLRYRSSCLSSNDTDDDDKDEMKGQWELKRGSTSSDVDSKTTTSKATVYEEIEGEEALLQARELIETFQRSQHATADNVSPSSSIDAAASANNTKEAQNLYLDYDDIPQSPIEIVGLAPLARIGTHRSTWRSSAATTTTGSDNNSLVVDLDATDFQYAVGEVETIVTDKSKIEAAQQELQEWLRQVLGETAVQGPPPMGKLEYYLSKHRPEILEILVEAGLMPTRS